MTPPSPGLDRAGKIGLAVLAGCVAAGALFGWWAGDWSVFWGGIAAGLLGGVMLASVVASSIRGGEG